jgi:tetrahydrodipicolinate N-succinyltransferase
MWTGSGEVQAGVITGDGTDVSSGAATEKAVPTIVEEPGEAAMRAMAAAAEMSTPALAMRTIEKKRFRVNQRGVFIYF